MRIFTGILVLLALGMVGCSLTQESHTTPPLPTGSWTLTAITEEPLPDPLPEGLRPITLTVSEGGAVSGSAGVNRYSGTVDTGAWANRDIVFGPLAVTRMAGPPAAMATESAYLGAINGVRTFRVEDGSLVLLGEAGELLRFERGAD